MSNEGNAIPSECLLLQAARSSLPNPRVADSQSFPARPQHKPCAGQCRYRQAFSRDLSKTLRKLPRQRKWNWGPALMPFIGVALILFKTLVIICGLQLLRYAALQETRGDRLKPLFRLKCKAGHLRYRLCGLSMAMALGPLAEVSAYAFAPQSLLAPLDGFDVIWNILPGAKNWEGTQNWRGWHPTRWVKLSPGQR